MRPPQRLPDRTLDILLEQELAPGERVLWEQSPRPSAWSGAALGGFLFGIPWTGFALLWTAGAATFWSTAVEDWDWSWSWGKVLGLAFPLFGVPFIVLGIGMLLGPYWQYRAQRSTRYVLTDRRAIILTGRGKTTIRSLWPNSLRDIYRKQKADGSGDLVIAWGQQRDSDGDWKPNELELTGIEDVQGVERQFRDLASRATPAVVISPTLYDQARASLPSAPEG